MVDGFENGRAPTFVVREGRRWLLTTVPASGTNEVSLDEVLALLPTVEPPVVARSTTALSDSTVLAPQWCWVGRVAGTGVQLEAPTGGALVLARGDLALLDVIDRPVPMTDVLSAAAPDARDRIGRLHAAGLLRVVDAAWEPGPEGDADPTGGPQARTVVTPPAADDGRVPVFSVWQEQVGPPLSLGMLVAAARGWRGGVLEEHFELRRLETAGEALAVLGAGRGPAVLLCSNYVWSLEENLALARRAKALRPELVVVHGGPSTPKYEGDAERFFVEHGDVADVLVRGEGEVVLCRVLEVLAGSLPGLDVEGLAGVPGISFRDGGGRVVRTGEPERVPDLDGLPSPYLTGEFDHLDADAWPFAVSIESNRGCPYGCTFCDWGSATLSRIRKFDLERVLGEIRWAADRGVGGIQFCDANFGILPRDVDIALGLAEIREATGQPSGVGLTPPKNTTRHITRILDALMDAGILVSTAISLQTTDEATLAAVERSNISTDGYLALAADLRRRAHPLMGDLLLGLPGQTYDAYKADLQFFVDHEIMARTWFLKMLPNAPMNEPSYRERHGIEVDDRAVVTSTATLAGDDMAEALRLRRAEIIGQRHGVLRHVGFWLQWDHGVPFTDLLEHLVTVTRDAPDRFPLLTWLFDHFDMIGTAPQGWGPFYGEVRRLLVEEHGVEPASTSLATVLRVQEALMPAPGRGFPATVALEHDYVAYVQDATASLYTSGRATGPTAPLSSYPPGELTVTGDPLALCEQGLRFDGDSRDLQFEGDFVIGMRTANELASPLLSLLPVFSGHPVADRRRAEIEERLRAPVESDLDRRRHRIRRRLPVEAEASEPS